MNINSELLACLLLTFPRFISECHQSTSVCVYFQLLLSGTVFDDDDDDIHQLRSVLREDGVDAAAAGPHLGEACNL